MAKSKILLVFWSQVLGIIKVNYYAKKYCKDVFALQQEHTRLRVAKIICTGKAILRDPSGVM
ncbi:MAG TPA: hypothetical protein DDZ97_13395 [Deltaproteobacteria bacterium]|nr:hypothetical protein [Deltaproteobacteria bacterium]